jgi:hypothetical protein
MGGRDTSEAPPPLISTASTATPVTASKPPAVPAGIPEAVLDSYKKFNLIADCITAMQCQAKATDASTRARVHANLSSCADWLWHNRAPFVQYCKSMDWDLFAQNREDWARFAWLAIELLMQLRKVEGKTTMRWVILDE